MGTTVRARKVKAHADVSLNRNLGQVMTPPDVAEFMADLLAPEVVSTVLDAGAGRGELSLAILRRFPALSPKQLSLVETDPSLAGSLRTDPRLVGASVLWTDFIGWAADAIRAGHRWDRIIANPPYLNYHDYNRESIGTVNAATGFGFSQLSNSYALFLALSSRLLARGGRMVFITPTELLTTNYGGHTLRAVCSALDLERIVVFDPGAEPFERAATSSCVSSFRRREIRTESVEIDHVLSRPDSETAWTFAGARTVQLGAFLAAPKEAVWGDREAAGETQAKLCPLGALVRASRGIATGANSFFVLDAATRSRIDPQGCCTVPVISHARDLGPKLVFTSQDFAHLSESGSRCWLLYLVGREEIPPETKLYLETYKASEVRRAYLCRKRDPWYSSEIQEIPAGFVRVFGRDGMKVVINLSEARTLTCFHRLYHHSPPRIPEDRLLLLAIFLTSSLGERAASAQYRRYGSGLLKLEPADLERILVPDLRRVPPSDAVNLLRAAEEATVGGSIPEPRLDQIAKAILAAVSNAPEERGLDRWVRVGTRSHVSHRPPPGLGS
jgi:adenine-specific DNA-methyltransferase